MFVRQMLYIRDNRGTWTEGRGVYGHRVETIPIDLRNVCPPSALLLSVRVVSVSLRQPPGSWHLYDRPKSKREGAYIQRLGSRHRRIELGWLPFASVCALQLFHGHTAVTWTQSHIRNVRKQIDDGRRSAWLLRSASVSPRVLNVSPFYAPRSPFISQGSSCPNFVRGLQTARRELSWRHSFLCSLLSSRQIS